MLSNYLKMAMRTIKKHKGYSFINLAGLAIGMACCILIFLYVQDEISYDRYHEKADQIYRLRIDGEVGGSLSHFALCPFAAPPVFTEEIPEVVDYTRIVVVGRQQVIGYEEKTFEERGIYLADPSFFKIFSHKFIAGNPETSLNEPGSVVITEEVANRLFEGEEPIGKVLKFGPVGDLHVTGVIQNVPRNSHFSFKYMISYLSIPEKNRQQMEQWLSIQGWAYVLLKKGANADAVQAKFPDIVETHTGQDSRKYGIALTFFLQKMTDIHLRSNLQGEIEATGNIAYVYVFSAIALFILIIACINFMNLSTARSANRAREVGLRKVFGAYRRNLIGQFLSESILLSITALIVAVVLVMLVFPLFNNFSGKELSSADLAKTLVVISMLVLILFTGLLAGSYPAFFLSGFQPIAVFRGILSKGAKSSFLRKALVVFQFAISVALIVGTGIVLNQLDYMKNKDLGFDKENVLVVLVQSASTRDSFTAVKAELQQNPNIHRVSYSSSVPGRIGELTVMIPEGASESETHSVYIMRCDYDYLDTFGLQLMEGRNFSKDFSTDATEAYIINETAARKFGWMDSALEKNLRFPQGRSGKVIGVIQDFHFQALQSEIEPLALMIDERAGAFVSLKISELNVADTLDFVKTKWEEFEPEREFNYFFLDEDLDSRYESEEKLSDILILFAVLAIFIACLGLFGLASFTAEQRTKEIGIRKVLGASVNNIVFHLSKEFVKWVIIANVIAWPLVYYGMTTYWLVNFPYRANPAVITFVIAGVLSIIIALITVSFQVIRAAVANPADSIRYE